MRRRGERAAKRQGGNDLRCAGGRFLPQPVYSAQEDPIGLAGDGYANGDLERTALNRVGGEPLLNQRLGAIELLRPGAGAGW